jgi:hypothetical protein
MEESKWKKTIVRNVENQCFIMKQPRNTLALILAARTMRIRRIYVR